MATDATAYLTRAYQDHGKSVFGFAARMCGAGAAEDVTQEVFLRLWRNPERFDAARGSLRTFLLTMTHSIAVDDVRSNEARRRREDHSSRSNGTVVFATSVEDEVEQSLFADRVELALAALPTREREAIVTAFYGRCTYREAALMLHQAEGTIKGRIRSGLRRLKGALAADRAADLSELPASL